MRRALGPYPENLVIVTKVGVRRGVDKSWPAALSARHLRDAVHDNLKNLGVEKLDVVNLRVGGGLGPNNDSIEEPLAVLAQMQQEGLIGHLGLSNITPAQFAEAKAIARIVCVQNHYNLAHRVDDAFIDDLASQGVAFAPFFPLGGFRPIKSPILDWAAARVSASPRQVAIAWLLQRSPNILVITGTSSVDHLILNTQAGELALPSDVVGELDKIAAAPGHRPAVDSPPLSRRRNAGFPRSNP